MRWSFSKGTDTLAGSGGIGPHGEFYFVPSKKPKLTAPKEALGASKVIPIFPRNHVLDPQTEQHSGIYEMRYREMIWHVVNNCGGVFGCVYYSQEMLKMSLVGTLARITRQDRMDDGGNYILMEGIGRFYVQEVVADKPYIKARVQIFSDFSEDPAALEELEQAVLREMRLSVKMMQILYPHNTYNLLDSVLRWRPPVPIDDVRQVQMPSSRPEMDRRINFSYAIMEMLKTDAQTKQHFLQEPVLERRFRSMLKVLVESTAFLEKELRKRGVITDLGLEKLKADMLADHSDLFPKITAATPATATATQSTQVPLELM